MNRLKLCKDEYINNIFLEIDEKRKKLTCCSKVNNNIIAIYDIPYHFDLTELAVFSDGIINSGYKGVNIGLTGFHDNGIGENEKLKFLISNFPILTAHGTSIKRTLSRGISYKDCLENDLLVLEQIPGLSVVNYDLYAGNSGGDIRNENFEQTVQTSLSRIAKRIEGSNNSIDAPSFIMEYLIQQLSAIYAGTTYMILLEIPGSRGRSMYPEVTMENVRYIVQLIKKYLPHNAKICLDVGHIFSRDFSKEYLDTVLQIIKTYQEYIGMLHISNAASYYNSFQEAYNLYTNENFPKRHIEGLDLQCVVSEKEMLGFIEEIRKICTINPLYEVTESRPAYLTVKDYFNGKEYLVDKQRDLQRFITTIKEQSKLLGYG